MDHDFASSNAAAFTPAMTLTTTTTTATMTMMIFFKTFSRIYMYILDTLEPSFKLVGFPVVFGRKAAFKHPNVYLVVCLHKRWIECC